MVLDASIRSRLEKLRKSVAQRGVRRRRAPDGDQAGRDRKHPARADRGAGRRSPPTSPRSAPCSRSADGIARIHGLDNCMALEMLELPHGVTGLALNLEADNVGAVLFGEWDKIVEGDTVKRTGHLLRDPGRRASCSAAWSTRSAARSTTSGEIATTETRPAEFKAPGVVERQPVDRAGADRADVDRRDDPDRPRPARADHRRPPDRQDGDRDRHDHQQQATRT